MVAKNLIDSVFALPLADQIELLERLRDRLRNEVAHSPLSHEHRKLPDGRLDDFERDPSEGAPWDEEVG